MISATDPVSILAVFKEISTDQNLFQVIFGESVLNDASSYVLYQAVKNYAQAHFQTLNPSEINPDSYYNIATETFKLIGVFIYVVVCSALIGFIMGYITSLILKLISHFFKDYKKIEITFLLCLPWVSYIIPQIYGLCGILSILFNGFAHVQFTKPNLSEEAEKVFYIN